MRASEVMANYRKAAKGETRCSKCGHSVKGEENEKRQRLYCGMNADKKVVSVGMAMTCDQAKG